jgi:hypothetical protein
MNAADPTSIANAWKFGSSGAQSILAARIPE